MNQPENLLLFFSGNNKLLRRHEAPFFEMLEYIKMLGFLIAHD